MNRLGYGGGYYDRLIKKLSKKKRIIKIGLALSAQEIDKVPINMYDQKLDYIVTNKYISKMKILFLGDVVGISGRSMILNNLLSKIRDKKIDFVVVNGENAADSGVGLTEEICKDFFNCGVDVITTGNHVWDQKETHVSY